VSHTLPARLKKRSAARREDVRLLQRKEQGGKRGPEGSLMRSVARLLSGLSALLILSCGCTPAKKKENDLDGRALLQQKCAECHNLEIPPETSPDEVAPPMMAVAFHIADFIKVATPAEKIPASIAFVRDYVMNPSREKSFCDPKSLDDYGLMPSQKGKLGEEELEAIAIYMFEHYNQENFLRTMKERQALREMAPGERVARKYGCISCHGMTQKKMGPSFKAIAGRYQDAGAQIKEGIAAGSQGKWDEARGARMPAFKQLTNAELNTVSAWIMEVK
jgi:cytochrome c